MWFVNAPCVHFCSEWSILGYGTGAFWDLWIRSISSCQRVDLRVSQGLLSLCHVVLAHQVITPPVWHWHYGNQSRGCLMGGGPLWPTAVPGLAGTEAWVRSRDLRNLEFRRWGSSGLSSLMETTSLCICLHTPHEHDLDPSWYVHVGSEALWPDRPYTFLPLSCSGDMKNVSCTVIMQDSFASAETCLSCCWIQIQAFSLPGTSESQQKHSIHSS